MNQNEEDHETTRNKKRKREDPSLDESVDGRLGGGEVQRHQPPHDTPATASDQSVAAFLEELRSSSTKLEQQQKKLRRVARLQELAGQGHVKAQYKLAKHYSKDGHDELAVEWWRKAADQGYAPAQFCLGRMYHAGKGVEVQSDERAVEWYRMAALQDHAEAQSFLGFMYRKGKGVKAQSDALAAEWWIKAAQQGEAKAQFQLGVMHLKGKGDIEAANWFRQAALQGHAKAQFELGKLYMTGTGVEEESKQLAAKWWLKSAQQGYARAELGIGLMYSTGDGVGEVSDRLAIKWLERAALQQNQDAQYFLANEYAQRNDQESLQRAVEWWNRAGISGHAAALYSLGKAFELGRGVERDKEVALDIYREAATRGNGEARQAVNRLRLAAARALIDRSERFGSLAKPSDPPDKQRTD